MFARIRARNPNSSVIKSLICTVCRFIARMTLKGLFGARSLYAERVPAEGALLIVANHQSFLDPPMIGAFVKQRQIVYIARLGLFKSRFFGWFIGALNAIPIREDGQSDTPAIKAALSVLARGHALAIFPEGRRTPDGALQPFKRGTALLFKRAKCPVQPVAVEGNFDAWPIGAPRPRPFTSPTMIMFGEPIPYDDLMKDGVDAAMVRLAREIDAMRHELRAKIRERTGGKYPAAGAGDAYFSEPAAGASDTLTA
jgi:1-acyl-sn-glycerol-3-phosphate acyltransferase